MAPRRGRDGGRAVWPRDASGAPASLLLATSGQTGAPARTGDPRLAKHLPHNSLSPSHHPRSLACLPPVFSRLCRPRGVQNVVSRPSSTSLHSLARTHLPLQPGKCSLERNVAHTSCKPRIPTLCASVIVRKRQSQKLKDILQNLYDPHTHSFTAPSLWSHGNSIGMCLPSCQLAARKKSGRGRAAKGAVTGCGAWHPEGRNKRVILAR
ncbi:hypothetical protein DFH27DRAFT_80999 [Peziza echinospora]|nr:hypothetical protein DFH27DRAFT_80999 [Peziza echinospora]